MKKVSILMGAAVAVVGGLRGALAPQATRTHGRAELVEARADTMLYRVALGPDAVDVRPSCHCVEVVEEPDDHRSVLVRVNCTAVPNWVVPGVFVTSRSGAVEFVETGCR